MTRQEFLDTLGRALRRELSEQEVLKNIQYYEDYIDREVQNGENEVQVLSRLGDPRLIARTILQVDEQKAEESFGYSGATVYTEGEDGAYREEPGMDQKAFYEEQIKVHRFGWKERLILILIIVAVFLILGTVFAVFLKLLPVILLIAAAVWLYRRFFS